MRTSIVVAAIVCLLGSRFSYCQNHQDANKPKFGYLQCRADAQKWTYDPIEEKDPRFLTGTAIFVNGQFRVLPQLTYHATVSDLLKRAYEMQVCMSEDSEFQKQYNTYALMYQAYSDERTFRYMNFITKHNLDQQFIKEDAEDFK